MQTACRRHLRKSQVQVETVHRYLMISYDVVCPEQRLKTATELIEKDDEARDILGLQKPTLLDFQDISLKHTMLRDSAKTLFKLGIGEDPGQSGSGSKRL